MIVDETDGIGFTVQIYDGIGKILQEIKFEIQSIDEE